MIERGAPIAVIAPCGAYDVDRFERGLQIAREHGLNPVPLPGNLQPWRYLAGTDAHRRAQLLEAYVDPQYAAVWAARGGYGLTRILGDLDLPALPRKPFVGFSDVTALFTGLHRVGGGPCVHGPVVHSLPISDDASIASLVAVLRGERPALPGVPWLEGTAEGPVVGGNLCLLAATAGTPQQLDARGCILVLEEIAEPGYKIDRMLQQLRSAGILEGVAAVALGDFVDCRVREGATWTLRDILLDHLEPLGVPVVAELPVGHGAHNHSFVWGTRATVGPNGLVFASSA